MKYPLSLSFKVLALASQIYVRDADGTLVGYVKQKLFKLKEDINVSADETQTNLLYNIKADRIIDFSAVYTFRDAKGGLIGSVKRRGMRSLWNANYEVYDRNGTQVMKINEENAWVKVADAVLREIPVLSLFSGYFFNPSYLVARMDDGGVARLDKKPAFFESKFELNTTGKIAAEEESLVLLSVLTMTLLERSRG